MGEFRFCTSVKLVEITGRRAATLEELLDGIRQLDGSVIFHHTHHFVLRHQYLTPEPPNEFAVWAGEALQERDLAERLLAINTVEFTTIRALRERLAAVVEGYLRERPRVNPAPSGMEFHFLRARSFVLPTALAAADLPGFRDALARAGPASIYHHVFEARLRLERGTNDFSAWLEGGLGERDLAAAIARLDPYTHTLETLRQAMLDRVQERMRT
jgi:hypothetical protein